jgi:hypothetical protein
MMNKKNLPHIITVVSFVVFILLGLASASTPIPIFTYAYHGHVQTVKNDTGSTVVRVYSRDTGTTNWEEHEKEKITASWSIHLTPMNNGTQMDLFYSLYPGSSETPPRINNQDIRMVDDKRIVYIKFNVPIALKSIDSTGKVIDNSDPITFTAQDRQPMLTIQNNTGQIVSITTPVEREVRNGASYSFFPANIFSFPELKQKQNITVAYDIGNTYQYDEQVTVNNDDVTLTLTRSPPVVTIENNTGNTVNLVFVRNPGTNWPAQNLLNPDTAQSTERRGSITNRESFRCWLGNAYAKPDRYDIRLDDVQGNSYVKSNVQITQDMTLTFTPSDKR